jgi:hypothetical protein
MSNVTLPPALFLGHCTPENITNADAILTNDLLDDSGSYSDGEDTDDNDNFQLLIKAANSDKNDDSNSNNDSDNDDDDNKNCYISNDEDEVENLREDQKMPTELVLSVAHGYGMVPLHQLQTHSTAQIKLFSFHWILKLVGSTVESARYLLNSKIWRAKISSTHLIPM